MRYARHMRIVEITSTTTATPLRTLIAEASKTLPAREAIEVRLSPDADLAVSTLDFGDELVVLADTTKTFPFDACLDELVLKNAATVLVELYFA